MLKTYFQLRRRVDRLVDSITARYSEQIACRPTCSKCCSGGLTLTIVEAVALGRMFNIEPNRIYLQAGQAPLNNSDRCAFLDKNNLCKAYAERPFVCRTQGMPLLLPNSKEISICDLNFIGPPPHSSAVINTENLETALFAANLDYCQKAGLHPMSRVAIDRIAQLAGFDTDTHPE